MKYKLNKSIIYALLGLVVGILLMKVANPAQQQGVAERFDAAPSPSSTTNPLGYIAFIDTSNGEVYVEMSNDRIVINPFEGSIGKQITIKKEDYPGLFEQGVANSNTLMAAEYIDPQSSEMFIRLSNNQPDHFGISSTYVLLVNPISGETKEGINDYQTQE